MLQTAVLQQVVQQEKKNTNNMYVCKEKKNQQIWKRCVYKKKKKKSCILFVFLFSLWVFISLCVVFIVCYHAVVLFAIYFFKYVHTAV